VIPARVRNQKWTWFTTLRRNQVKRTRTAFPSRIIGPSPNSTVSEREFAKGFLVLFLFGAMIG
jgi:hypothetical protein